MRRLSAILVATALLSVAAVVGAAPALAVTGGFGIAKALKTRPLPVSFEQATAAKKHPICEASGKNGSTKSTSANELEKRFTPVACEQPPRSQAVTSDALKYATAAALAVLG